MTYRTLRQAQTLRDHSNHTLRFHRSLRETRMPTQEFLEMSKHRDFPVRIAIVLFGAVAVPVIVMVLEWLR